MLDLIFKPYINYKIKDIINAEIQSSINENYKSPYLYDPKWMEIAWIIHRAINDCKEKVEEACAAIDNMNLTDEQRKEAYKQIKLVPKYDSNGQFNLDIKFTVNN